MRTLRVMVVALAASVSLGCENPTDSESRTMWEGSSYSDPGKLQRLKDALSNAGIPYETHTDQGKEFVRWDASYSAKVQGIKDSLFLPSGRNIRFDPPRHAQFKQWLRDNGVPYREMVEDGMEYVVWEEEDAERVRAWPNFPSYYDEPPLQSSK